MLNNFFQKLSVMAILTLSLQGFATECNQERTEYIIEGSEWIQNHIYDAVDDTLYDEDDFFYPYDGQSDDIYWELRTDQGSGWCLTVEAADQLALKLEYQDDFNVGSLDVVEDYVIGEISYIRNVLNVGRITYPGDCWEELHKAEVIDDYSDMSIDLCNNLENNLLHVRMCKVNAIDIAFIDTIWTDSCIIDW